VVVNNWIAAAVIGGLLAAVASYAVYTKGLPVRCYKENPVDTLAPSGAIKAVTYHYNCQNSIFGVDFGLAASAKTGIEIAHVGDIIDRDGFRPVIEIAYRENNYGDAMKDKPPVVKLEWRSVRDLVIHHSKDSKNIYPFSVYRSYRIISVADL